MSKAIEIRYLERRHTSQSATWGVPWQRGECTDVKRLVAADARGRSYPTQSAVRAKWPDGSVKWSLHSADLTGLAGDVFTLTADMPAKLSPLCRETEDGFILNTGLLQARLQKRGGSLIESLSHGGHTTCTGAVPVVLLEHRDGNTATTETFSGAILSAALEENGGVRCVLCFRGTHGNGSGETAFPFVIRLYFYKNSADVRISHTFLYDRDAKKDFIKGIGVRFLTPMEHKPYNRHVLLAGDEGGFFHETPQLLTSWRPKLDPRIYEDQLAGREIVFDEQAPGYARDMEAVNGITLWDAYTLYQDSSEHFCISKRTKSEACAYVRGVHGRRAGGLLCVGSVEKGLGVGMRDFWQKYPSALSAEHISDDTAALTAWLWPPQAEAADLRHYDDRAHAGAYYEGFDELRSTPYGIANTNEITLFSYAGVPDETELTRCVAYTHKPPVLVCTPEYMRGAGAFGVWSLPARVKAPDLETVLDTALDFYRKEVDARKWYGLFDYGDFMHTYDDLRHMWKYDMGGYAWQNTELVPTLWLWLMFLRSGREDVFTLAEAMTRHCSEVDVYHFGEYQGLGSRHNVVHWGCACKEARIAMAFHHRFLYYITGDERLGDVFNDVTGAEYGVQRLDPLRFFYDDGMKTHARTGPDWSSLCSNWFTAWERHGDAGARDKIRKGIETIAKAPMRLISGSDFGFDPDTGEMLYIGESAAGGSHLAVCMGAPSVWFEIAQSLDDPALFEDMLAEYGAFYLLSPAEKRVKSGGLIQGDGWSFPYMAAAICAYSAQKRGDAKLAKQVWEILRGDARQFHFAPKPLTRQPSAFAVQEQPRISTNFAAQWCLNVIMCLELIGDYV
ncbi:MAG: hypothetical protein ABIG45_02865 [Bacillota bacterium]